MKKTSCAIVIIFILVIMFSVSILAETTKMTSDKTSGKWFLLGKSFYEVYIPNTLIVDSENDDFFFAHFSDEENNYEVHIMLCLECTPKASSQSTSTDPEKTVHTEIINGLNYDYFEFDDVDLDSDLVTYYNVYWLNDSLNADGTGFFRTLIMYYNDKDSSESKIYVQKIVESLRKNENYDKLSEINIAPCQPGERSEDVHRLKLRLQELGYFKAHTMINNEFNETTTERIVKFQKEHNLEITGNADVETIIKMFE